HPARPRPGLAGGAVMTAAIPRSAALLLQLAAVRGQDLTALIEVRAFAERRCIARDWYPAADLGAPIAAVQALAPTADVYIGAAPRTGRAGGLDAIKRVWTLWADLDGEQARDACRRFAPLPSIVVATGTPGHACAWWPLREPLSGPQARLLN